MFDNSIEITWEEVQSESSHSYKLIDIRDKSSIGYGVIPGAVSVPQDELKEHIEELKKENAVVLYCARGVFSQEPTAMLREHGIRAYSLKDRYNGWLIGNIQKEKEQENVQIERQKEIELSIRKKFHKKIFSKFAKAINQYELLKENDKVAVCISGGKVSLLSVCQNEKRVSLQQGKRAWL